MNGRKVIIFMLCVCLFALPAGNTLAFRCLDVPCCSQQKSTRDAACQTAWDSVVIPVCAAAAATCACLLIPGPPVLVCILACGVAATACWVAASAADDTYSLCQNDSLNKYQLCLDDIADNCI